MGEPLAFRGIGFVGHAGLGGFRLDDERLGWKCADKSLPDSQVQKFGAEISSAEWQQFCGPTKYLLKLCFKDNVTLLRFTGFQQENFQSLKSHMSKHFNVELQEAPINTDGWSWGEWELHDNHTFRIMAKDKTSMEIPIGELSQVSTIGKGDLTLEFQEDGSMGDVDEVLHEMRLAIPPSAGSEMTAEGLKGELQQRAGLSAGGDAVARVPEVSVVAPRGKHSFEFFQKAMKMHGKTQTYTIKYGNIARLFLLELPDHTTMDVVVGLDQPVRQGQQHHDFLVLQCPKTVHAQLTEEESKKLPEELQCAESQPLFQLMGKLLKHMSGKPVVASASDFTELHPKQESCIRCSYKTQPGFLFPLKKSLIFVNKPVFWIRYDDVECLEFVTGSMRRNSFDLLVRLKNKQVVEFVHCDQEAFQAIADYFQKVGVPIANLKEVHARLQGNVRRAAPPAPSAGASSKRAPAQPAADADEEEDDEDFEDEGGEGESSEEEPPEEEEDEPQPTRASKRPRR